MAHARGLEANSWKMFLYLLSQRRNFITILSIFFLTLPDTTARQIGLYGAIGSLAGFLFEVPSGYFSDRFGHKNTLIIAKILMLLSGVFFLIADGFALFLIGSVLITVSFAFASGTVQAFMHDTYIALKKEGEYGVAMNKISGYVSLVSAVLIVLLPFLVTIDIRAPIAVGLAFDVMGLAVVFSFTKPPQAVAVAQGSIRELVALIRKAARPGFYATSIFVGAIGGFMMAEGGYRWVYLESLGFPIIFLGFVQGLSRFIWFLVGHYSSWLHRRISTERLMLIEIFLFPALLVSVALMDNPYAAGVLFAIMIGYFWGRNELITHHFLEKFIADARYKATMLSVKSQVQALFEMVLAFFIGFVMQRSYKLGYLTLGLALLAILAVSYQAIPKQKPPSNRSTS